MIERNEPKINRVLVYGHTPRAFQTTLIGYLYEIAQVYPTILLSEKLDPETETVLRNRELFPKLEKVIPARQFTGPKMGLFAKNRYLFKLAKDTIDQYKPDILILANDHFPFELYLARFAKRINTIIISIQIFCCTFPDRITPVKWVDLTNAYSRFPSFLPLWFRLLLVRCRKSLGHFLYYWILPLTINERPFLGKSSFILRRGLQGMRDADYEIVFSERDYNIYRDAYLEYGTPIDKLYILPHPLTLEMRKFFERVYLNKLKKLKDDKENKKIITMMLPEIEMGFKRKDYSLITREKIERTWVEIIKLANQTLPDWKIYIKPHPDIKDINEIEGRLESISDNIKVVDPQESVDKYIEIGDIIIGLPLSVSTTLFAAFLQCPQKPIISLDFNKEVLGDAYKDKDFRGIEYIDNKDEFINVLKLIRDNKYRKRNFLNKINKSKPEPVEFSNTIEMINYLYQKKRVNKIKEQ